MREHGVKTPVFDWAIDFDHFCVLLKHMRDSAPGPDGLPYSAWARAPACVKQLLFVAYSAFLRGEDLSCGFNHAFMAILPKGERRGAEAIVLPLAEELLPPCLSNTDAKIFASAMKSAAEEHISKWSLHTQRGFTRG